MTVGGGKPVTPLLCELAGASNGLANTSSEVAVTWAESFLDFTRHTA